MAAKSNSEVIDTSKPGKYPIILGESIVGGTVKDIFTAVRYNHRPSLSSASAPAQARLKPSIPGDQSSFDLAFADGAGKYAYAGTRTTNDNQYVMHFDPGRKAFVLDKIDSTFHMNLTRTPDDTDPESLRKQFQQLDTNIKAQPKPPSGSTSASQSSSSSGNAAKPLKSALKSRNISPSVTRRDGVNQVFKKPERRKDPKSVDIAASKPPLEPPKPQASSAAAQPKKRDNPPAPKSQSAPQSSLPPKPKSNPPPREKDPPAPLSLPTAPPPKSDEKGKKRPKTPAASSDEDSDDSDGGLLVEYPGGDPNRRTDFSPSFPAQFTTRRFSDFIRDNQEQDDEDDDDDDDDDDQMPSDMPPRSQPGPNFGQLDDGDEEDDEDDEVEMVDVDPIQAAKDAEAAKTAKELEAAFEADLEADLEAGLEADLEADLEAGLAGGEVDEFEAALENGFRQVQEEEESEVSEEE